MRINGVNCEVIVTDNTEMKYYNLEKFSQPTIQIVSPTAIPAVLTSVPGYRAQVYDRNEFCYTEVLAWNKLYAAKVGDFAPEIDSNGEVTVEYYNIRGENPDERILRSKISSCNEILLLLGESLPSHSEKNLHRLAMKYGFNSSRYMAEGFRNTIDYKEYITYSSLRFPKLYFTYNGKPVSTHFRGYRVDFTPSSKQNMLIYTKC